MKRFILGLYCCCLVGVLGAQEWSGSVNMDSVQVRLMRLAETDPAYLSEVDISAGKLPLGELLRMVAQANAVNLCVKTDNNLIVTCNFKRTRVTDLLYYLCREYNLELKVVGNIVSIATTAPVVCPPRIPEISFDSVRGFLGYDLTDDNLVGVAKRIAWMTGENIIVPQTLYQNRVSGFSSGLPVREAIALLMDANGFQVQRGKKGVWTILVPEMEKERPAGAYFSRARHILNPDQIKADSLGKISVSINQANIQDIVIELCTILKIDHVFLAPLDRQTTLHVHQTDFVSLLNVLFTATPFTYRIENGIYLFGGSEQQKSLTTTRVVPMRYRTVEKVSELIPETLKTGVQILPFPDRNSLIVSGDIRLVTLIEEFITTVDKSVPLITIEVMIVDSRKSSIREAGISAGLGDKPVKTTGTLSPGIDVSLSSSSVNKLINSFNGFGTINLGKVTPDFYLTLKALEENGSIQLRSTPRLSTLNGHEATLKSGETKYYKEVQNSIIGTQNPIQSESYSWKSIEANLSLKIIPFVSLDGKITLTIEIEQCEFTAREEKGAPPGTAIRSFKSQIKVNNDEMVLLGGIDRNSREKSSSGLPFIARIPVLKWLFGVTRDNKVDEKLNVFIKPSVAF